MPLRKMDFISRLLALAEPVPFTVAILMAKSLMRSAVDADMGGLALWGGVRGRRCSASGDLGLLRLQHACFVGGVRPMHVGLLHVPRGGRATFGAQAAVNAEILVLHHHALCLRQ